MTKGWKKDFWRPIFGTILLQPLMVAWALWTDTSYLTNLGPLTIVTTIYLIPVYRWYEKFADMNKFDEPKWM